MSGIMQPAQSAWECPVVLANEGDGSLRFCVNYWKLNAVTIRYTYPLTHMDECIDKRSVATIFKTLEASYG